MKTFVISLVFLLSSSLLPGSSDNILLGQENKKIDFSTFGFNREAINSYEYIYLDGKWWIYEYDEDGRLVNIYPIDD